MLFLYYLSTVVGEVQVFVLGFVVSVNILIYNRLSSALQYVVDAKKKDAIGVAIEETVNLMLK